MYRVRERLYLTPEGTVVPEAHPDAHMLAVRYGLTGQMDVETRAPQAAPATRAVRSPRQPRR
jgi:hypothetical protein